MNTNILMLKTLITFRIWQYKFWWIFRFESCFNYFYLIRSIHVYDHARKRPVLCNSGLSAGKVFYRTTKVFIEKFLHYTPQ